MKKTLIKAIPFLLLIVFFASCSKIKTTTLTFSPKENLTFAAEDDTRVLITVTTNADGWNVKSSATWCKAEKNNQCFIVTVTENTTESMRFSKIVVSTSDSSVSDSLSVTQAAAIPE